MEVLRSDYLNIHEQIEEDKKDLNEVFSNVNVVDDTTSL